MICRYHEKMGELELKRKEIERLEARLQHTVHHKQMEGIRKLQQTIGIRKASGDRTSF